MRGVGERKEIGTIENVEKKEERGVNVEGKEDSEKK